MSLVIQVETFLGMMEGKTTAKFFLAKEGVVPLFEQEIHAERLGWFINLRWMAALAGAVILLAGIFLAPLGIQYGRLSLCVLLLVLANTAYYFYWKKLRSPVSDEMILAKKVRPFLHFQMMGDLTLLTVMLYFSGGAENPLVLLYLFHLAISAMIFSVSESFFYAGVALVLPWILYAAERFSAGNGSLWEGISGLSRVHESSDLLAYSVTVTGLWFFLSRLSSDIRSKETALRQTHDQLKAANEALEQLDTYKNQFLRQVVFQLKSPTIEMDFDLSSVEKALPAKNEKAMAAIHTAKKRVWALLEMIEDLVWLSRMRVHDMPFKKEWVDVYGALLKRVQAIEEEALKKGITFQLHGDPGIRLRADHGAFDRVAENLFSNAVKYTPAGTHTVTAEFWVEGDWLVLSVQDEGIGIPPKQQGRIFDEFFRASNAKSMERFGTGLGLSIVKRIMDWHGGKVNIASTTKEGTKVETLWPLDGGVPAAARDGG